MTESARQEGRKSRVRSRDASPAACTGSTRRPTYASSPPQHHTLHPVRPNTSPPPAAIYALQQVWHKTSLAHLIPLMKMRPAHPLPAPASRQSLHARSRVPPVPTRARVIDPRMYGAVHLGEDMLAAVVASQPAHGRAASVRGRRSAGVDDAMGYRGRGEQAARLGRGAGARAGAGDDDVWRRRARLGGAESAANDVPDGPDDTYTSSATAMPPAHAAAVPAPPPKSKPLKDLSQPRQEEVVSAVLSVVQ
ncbi:hypothetical protein JB92DRAFT_3114285 [Gautieria morchelliformis]|nr:hypothetical protein JB92DRAFT_3114285 [Gautieria morchelliformis]